VGGVLLLGVLLWRLGTAPVVHGIRTVDGWSLAAATCVALGTTVCSAARWRLVAAALEVPIGLRDAVGACYRAQFLNVTLPGGVLGDVHRGVRHGRGAGTVGRSLRAVGWERGAGQAVQLALAAVAIVALPSALGPWVRGLGAAALVTLLVTAVLASRAKGYAGRSRWVGVLGADLRSLLSARAQGAGRAPAARVVLLSVAVVVGHVATFALAARATASPLAPVSLAELVPVALLVLVASALPVNIAGWGPREGAAAWAFAASGWGAAQGLATAVAYGVLVFVASLPGAAVLGRELTRGPARGGVSRG
jgi:uncharacterized membrane protein YbhN (UPF0104 family)